MNDEWISVSQSLSRVWLFGTPWIAGHQASLSITNSQSSLKLMSIKSVVPSSHFILCRPLLLPPQSFPASGSFPRSHFFASGGQSIGASASTSVLPMNIQDCQSLRYYKRLKHRTCSSQWSKLYRVLLFLNLVSRGAATYLLASVTWGRDEIRQQLEAWLG